MQYKKDEVIKLFTFHLWNIICIISKCINRPKLGQFNCKMLSGLENKNGSVKSLIIS